MWHPAKRKVKMWQEKRQNVARERCGFVTGAVFTHSHIHTFNWEGRLRKVKTGQEEGEDRSFTHSHIYTFTHYHIHTFNSFTHSHIHTFKLGGLAEEGEDRSRGR